MASIRPVGHGEERRQTRNCPHAAVYGSFSETAVFRFDLLLLCTSRAVT